jgi:hypothetical protein
MKSALLSLLLIILVLPETVEAQDANDEVIVTALRRDADSYSADIPAIGLRRTADFAVQEITITGDSRDSKQRTEEIYTMLANAIAAAPKAGVQLASGDATIFTVTMQNYRTLTLRLDQRPDSQKIDFLIKTPLGTGTDTKAAQQRINSFVKTVKTSGRAIMETSGDLTFSVVNPDQYRGAIADLVAADAKAMAARLGTDYGVEIEGLNRPVEWARIGLSEVLLYMPYKLVLKPKR